MRPVLARRADVAYAVAHPPDIADIARQQPEVRQ
jgi:hypothetical protein